MVVLKEYLSREPPIPNDPKASCSWLYPLWWYCYATGWSFMLNCSCNLWSLRSADFGTDQLHCQRRIHKDITIAEVTVCAITFQLPYICAVMLMEVYNLTSRNCLELVASIWFWRFWTTGLTCIIGALLGVSLLISLLSFLNRKKFVVVSFKFPATIHDSLGKYP